MGYTVAERSRFVSTSFTLLLLFITMTASYFSAEPKQQVLKCLSYLVKTCWPTGLYSINIVMSAWMMRRCHEGLKAVHRYGVKNSVVKHAHCALTHFYPQHDSSLFCHTSSYISINDPVMHSDCSWCFRFGVSLALMILTQRMLT